MKKMPSFLRYSLISLLLGAVSVVGCGSDDDDGSGPGGDGAGGFSLGPGGGPGSARVRDGGSVELNEEEVRDILNAQCTGWSAEGENLPAVLQLVVDVSRSMRERAPGSDRSKWAVTRDALEDAIAQLPPSVAVGLLLYPNRGIRQYGSTEQEVSACVDTDAMIPIAPLGQSGSNHRQSLAEAFEDATIENYTPTHDAYAHALNDTNNGLLAYQGNASKFMLLITDGAPTLSQSCVNPGGGNGVSDAPTQPIIDDIEAAFDDHGVRTFLIGSPGSEESSESGTDMRPWLSQAALAGGTATSGCDADGPDFCHMDMTEEPDFGAALSQGLASIAGQIIDSCTFALPDPPAGETIDPKLTNVIITWGDGKSSLILGDDIGDCTVGWQADGTRELTLCPETCDSVKADNGARLHLAFGCSEDTIIR